MYKGYLSFCEMLNTFIGTECLCGAVDLVCDLLSGDIGVIYDVRVTEKYCDHSVPFILHSLNVSSKSVYISEKFYFWKRITLSLF
jgi:hypothetical protein